MVKNKTAAAAAVFLSFIQFFSCFDQQFQDCFFFIVIHDKRIDIEDIIRLLQGKSDTYTGFLLFQLFREFLN